MTVYIGLDVHGKETVGCGRVIVANHRGVPTSSSGDVLVARGSLLFALKGHNNPKGHKVTKIPKPQRGAIS